MKEVTLRIPKHKMKFFLELVEELGFEVVDENDISDDHKKIVTERYETTSEDEFLTWKEARSWLRYPKQK
jgi:hypothetical protein